MHAWCKVWIRNITRQPLYTDNRAGMYVFTPRSAHTYRLVAFVAYWRDLHMVASDMVTFGMVVFYIHIACKFVLGVLDTHGRIYHSHA